MFARCLCCCVSFCDNHMIIKSCCCRICVIWFWKDEDVPLRLPWRELGVFVILVSMSVILLSIQSVIRYLICDNNLNWLLNLNLIYETLWTGARSALLISMLGKFNWFCLTSLITPFYWHENGWVYSWGKIIF